MNNHPVSSYPGIHMLIEIEFFITMMKGSIKWNQRIALVKSVAHLYEPSRLSHKWSEVHTILSPQSSVTPTRSWRYLEYLGNARAGTTLLAMIIY